MCPIHLNWHCLYYTKKLFITAQLTNHEYINFNVLSQATLQLWKRHAPCQHRALRVSVLSVGASCGIGAQTAVLFARLGSQVALTARGEANLLQTAAECERQPAAKKVNHCSYSRLQVKRIVALITQISFRHLYLIQWVDLWYIIIYMN